MLFAIMGDYNPNYPPHAELNNSLDRLKSQVDFEYTWFPTTELNISKIQNCNGLWSAPMPYKNIDAVMECIHWARKNNVPFIGTCGGFKATILEFAKNELNLSLEKLDKGHYDCVLLKKTNICSHEAQPVQVRPISDTHYGLDFRIEFSNCSFGIDEDFFHLLEAKGFEIVGLGEEDNPRILKLSNHPFYYISLFLPQLFVNENNEVHPLLVAMLKTMKDLSSKKIEEVELSL